VTDLLALAATLINHSSIKVTLTDILVLAEEAVKSMIVQPSSSSLPYSYSY
jgi:hypothetical protein